MNEPRTIPLQPGSKPHFHVLDGLRGIAALAVVVFHFMEWIFTDPNQNFIGHGFLAVDFFFCLSGFVIGYAYDNRIRKIGRKQFFKLRLIRLHPLVVLGVVLGLLGLMFDPFDSNMTYDGVKIALLFLTSLFLIPLPIMEERFFNNFALNAPAWSLFWEYVANIFYALVLNKIGRKSLIVLTVLAAGGLCLVSYRAGNLLGGWSKDNFFDGGARVAYSFSMGLLIFRSNWIIKNRIGFAGLGLLLLMAFMMPGTKWNWLTEALVVLLFFPLIVSFGAGATVSSGWRKVCDFSGRISYPLYMTHYAGIWIFGNYYTTNKPNVGTLWYVIPGGILLLIAFAYLAMILYDIPVRQYLARKTGDKLSRR